MAADRPFDPAQETYVSLASFRKNGKQVSTPVWMAEVDGDYFVFSKANAGKMKRIKNNKQVKLAACDMRGKLKSDWLSASAEITTDPEIIKKLYLGFNRKYGWQMRFGSWLTKLRGTYQDRGYLLIKINSAEPNAI